jgi:hypothetical protein
MHIVVPLIRTSKPAVVIRALLTFYRDGQESSVEMEGVRAVGNGSVTC